MNRWWVKGEPCKNCGVETIWLLGKLLHRDLVGRDVPFKLRGRRVTYRRTFYQRCDDKNQKPLTKKEMMKSKVAEV